MLFKLFFLIFAAALVVYWWQSAQIHELAIKAARRTCERCNVQFLDHTVAKTHTNFKRSEQGKLRLERSYSFEFSPNGTSRYSGNVHTVANRISAVIMEPYPEES